MYAFGTHTHTHTHTHNTHMQDCLPVRVGNILINNQGMMFSIFFKIVRLFIKEKLRKRIVLLGTNREALQQYVNVMIHILYGTRKKNKEKKVPLRTNTKTMLYLVYLTDIATLYHC